MMFRVTLPFWLVTERRGERPPREVPCDDPTAIHAFTTTSQLTEYLEGRSPGTWKVSFVADRPGVLLAIADAHHAGAETICFDPEPNGSGGERVPLPDLYRLSDALSA